MRARDGARGHEYRWREWFVRIFGWDCGYFLTPAVLHHRLYLRWAFRPQSTRWLGFSIGRDEDDEWAFSLGLVLLNIEAALPEYRRSPDVAPQPAVVETSPDLADSERSDAPLTIHPPSYLAGWNDAKAGRQYGEGRVDVAPQPEDG